MSVAVPELWVTSRDAYWVDPGEAEERSAFAAAVADHQPRIAQLVHRLLGWSGSPDEVADVVQEVLLAAWEHRDSFRGDSAWMTWLSRIAINKVRNHSRKQRLFAGFLRRHGEQLDREDVRTSHPDDDVAAGVRSAIGRMAQRDREVLVLRYLEDRSVDEIAAMLSLRRNAVDARLTRARRRMRELMESEEA